MPFFIPLTFYSQFTFKNSRFKMNQFNNRYSTTSNNHNDFFPGRSNDHEVEELKNSLLERDKVISTLMQKVKALEVNSESKRKQKSKAVSEKTTLVKKKLKRSTKSRRNVRERLSESPKKRHPLQMLTSEVPEDFYHTKEFNERFSTHEQIESSAESKSAANVISEKEVQTLRDARAGRKKIGKHIVYLEDFYFHYICSLLS
ncbi:hypothetical protein O181_016435 [Austropuccinia psidii MF-1]|uniref:Uncharacterized protein n=1 Tax=Austropuccinia psidii MF-1 TaxID=1389203 RepID=A0A9Q3C4U9_9BASI|nr:hypothetical protein [Austropuccinia psidii MF-1]